MALRFHLLITQCFRVWIRSKKKKIGGKGPAEFLFMLNGQMMTQEIGMELTTHKCLVNVS